MPPKPSRKKVPLTADILPRTTARTSPRAPSRAKSDHPFATQMMQVGRFTVRVGRSQGNGQHPPLLVFNGIGGNVELLAPLAEALSEREVITFDIPGVGQSEMPKLPYRLRDVVRIATGVLDQFGHQNADVLGVSWGGAVAQQFARSAPGYSRRLILCATATGGIMVPARPGVLLKMATPRRYVNRDYAKSIAGDIYGGDFRANAKAGGDPFKHIRWQSNMGYYLQLVAAAGWTSVHWLRRLRLPTLIMAGIDDPLIPLVNAKLMNRLIPNSELRTFDCGHLFLLTRLDESSKAIREFLDRP